MLEIINEAPFDYMFREDMFYVTQFNFKIRHRAQITPTGSIRFYHYITKAYAYDADDFRVAIFKVKPTSKPLSERLRQSKYIRANSIMEIADEIIYEALKNEAA